MTELEAGRFGVASYTAFYRLYRRPFALAPDLGGYLPTESHRRAIACLSHALERGEGVVLITGEAGIGKTMLVRYLEGRLGARRVLVPSLPAVATGGAAVLAALAAGLGLDPERAEPAGLPGAIEAELRARAPERGSLLIVLDEAQRPAPAALDALRPLVGLAGATGPLVRLVLVGRPELRERLASAPLAWLRERVAASHRLTPLEPEEVRPYIEHRLARAGWQEDPRLLAELFPAVRLATGGLPRRINQLMTRLLVLGALDQRHELGAAEVEEARVDLGDEPAAFFPMHAAATAPASGGESWRRELAALLRRLDALYEELARERRRRDDAEAEAARLRAELRRLGREAAAGDPFGGRSDVEPIPAEPAGGFFHG